MVSYPHTSNWVSSICYVNYVVTVWYLNRYSYIFMKWDVSTPIQHCEPNFPKFPARRQLCVQVDLDPLIWGSHVKRYNTLRLRVVLSISNDATAGMNVLNATKILCLPWLHDEQLESLVPKRKKGTCQ